MVAWEATYGVLEGRFFGGGFWRCGVLGGTGVLRNNTFFTLKLPKTSGKLCSFVDKMA